MVDISGLFLELFSTSTSFFSSVSGDALFSPAIFTSAFSSFWTSSSYSPLGGGLVLMPEDFFVLFREISFCLGGDVPTAVETLDLDGRFISIFYI